jgi:hypothetical protein
VAGFKTEAEAANAKQQTDALIKMAGAVTSAVPPNAPPEAREAIEIVADILESIDLSQSGDTLEVSVSVSTSDIEKLINIAQRRTPGFGGPSPTFSPF